MEKKGSGKFLRTMILFCFAALLGMAVYAFFRDGSPPSLSLTPQSSAASYNTEFTLKLGSARAGLKSFSVTASQDGKRVEILSRSFAGKTLEHTEVFRLPKEAGFKEGPFELSIAARDNNLLSAIGRGKSSLEVKLALDLTPPRISVSQGIHNVNQGGGGAVSFTVTKHVERAGVVVGEHFFTAFQQKGGEFICYFAMPHDMVPSSFKPRAVARDAAGNEAFQSLLVNAIPKTFKFDKLNLSDEFLNDKMSQYTGIYPNEKTPADIYKRVNNELRKQNEQELLKIGQDTANATLWSGPFMRLPSAAGRAGFGDQRDYFYHGEKIDHQTHLGVDLASVAHAPVPAANDGRVVFTGFFGIYGNCIIIDHGLGLQSLYSHLSQFDVNMGDAVKRGQTIAHTGATGLAGGDHLHFGMLISGVQVSPVEWWDEHWIKDNIVKHVSKQ